MKQPPRTLALALLSAALLTLPGCITALTTASVASIASITAATATTAEKGFGAWAGSQFIYVDETNLTPMRWAILSAFDRLELDVYKDSHDEKNNIYRWKVREADGDYIAKIKLESLTPRMTVVTINVGLFGNKPAGTLIASRIRDKLNQIKESQNHDITQDPPDLEH